MYSQALAGTNVQICSYEDPGLWIHPDISMTDGTVIHLPLYVDRYDSEEKNFAWYKAAATHQASHIEFGTFDFSFEKMASLFPSGRYQLPSTDGDGLNDLEKFFSPNSLHSCSTHFIGPKHFC